MAIANQNAITGKLSGTINKQLVFRQWGGTTVVGHFPKPRKGEDSAAQESVKNRFLLASRYAKSVLTNPDQGLADAYAKTLRPRQNVYSRAMEDFLSPPKVTEINTRHYRGNAGDPVIIRAVDDFRVTELLVEIYDAAGALLEEGTAIVENNGIDYRYTATLANGSVAGTTIKAIATDVPGNPGTMEVIL